MPFLCISGSFENTAFQNNDYFIVIQQYLKTPPDISTEIDNYLFLNFNTSCKNFN